MYAISPKIKCEGDIIRVSPEDRSYEYFFGYYDKSPWDSFDRFMLCLRANNTWSEVSPKESADILIIDTEKNEKDLDRVKKKLQKLKPGMFSKDVCCNGWDQTI